jgi:hypothetical protein
LAYLQRVVPGGEMADIHKFSEHVIDLAERLSNVADAAEGKGRRGGGSNVMTRWVLLPAAGAGFYALVKSEFFTRQAKGVVDEAKTRASDLPADLMKTVRQTGQKSPSRNGGESRQKTSSARKTTSGKTSSARKSKSVSSRS